MLLTRASEYAMLTLVLIAKQDAPEGVDTLSKRLNISRSFLAKILQSLAREGILKSFKGAKGGFSLNQKIEDISIRNVIEIVEKKPIIIFDCSQDINKCPTDKGAYCTIWPFLFKFQRKIDDFLNEMTLKDIL